MIVEEAAAPTVRGRQLARVVTAWALVAGCVAVLGAMLLAGGREAPYADLRAAVADGRVDEIRVAGGLDDDFAGEGFALAEVHWRDGLVPRVSQVFEASNGQHVERREPSVPTVNGRVDERLAELDPGLRATRAGELTGSTTDSDWHVPGWVVPLALALLVGSLGLIILGPEPRLATRWAWFWLFWLAMPLGALAFLLLGGATVPAVRTRPGRRLTGGWAFLLSFAVGASLSAVGAAVL